MKSIALYSVVAAVIIVVLYLLLNLIFTGAGAREALLISAAVAWLVQSITYATVRLASPANLMVGWGLGTILRFLVVIAFALIVGLATQISPAPALISLVTYFFVCTLVEPLFLKR